MIIEKNIPMPDPATNQTGGRRSNFPFRVMEVGDSFLVEGEKSSESAYNSMRQLNYRERKVDGGLHFEARREGKGYRIWRTR